MTALFEIIKSELKKHKVVQYQLDTVLVTVNPSETKTLNANNDFYFFANAFPKSGVANGFITGSGSGNAMTINPLTLNLKLHKHQMFKGNLLIENKDANNILYVEMVRITPVQETKNE